MRFGCRYHKQVPHSWHLFPFNFPLHLSPFTLHLQSKSIFGLGLYLQHILATPLISFWFWFFKLLLSFYFPPLSAPGALECALIFNTRKERALNWRCTAKPASISRFTFVVRCFKSASSCVEDRSQSARQEERGTGADREEGGVCRQSGLVLLALTSGHQAAATCCRRRRRCTRLPDCLSPATSPLPTPPSALHPAATAQSIMTFKWEPRCNLCASRRQAANLAAFSWNLARALLFRFIPFVAQRGYNNLVEMYVTCYRYT